MIRIENVSKNFGDVQAVRGLTLHVRRGELFCFLGPNGAGKTTTLKMMCGLLRPSSGRIVLGGQDLALEPGEARKIIGYIPDMPFLYDRLTPAEYFEFMGDLYGVPASERLSEQDMYFELFALKEYAGRLIKDLSHGYRQRLVYAATLLHKPKIIFIDEPFVGLDPHTITLIRSLLRSKTASGTTIFMTSHILALVETLADRIGIISDGKLAALGTLAELRSAGPAAGAGTLEDVFLRLTRADAAGEAARGE